MIRFSLSAATVALIFLHGSAIAEEVKGIATVKVQDPKRGSIPDMVYAYGTAPPRSAATVTESFQRDGRISDIFLEVGDQFKKGDPLLDFGAAPAAVIAYEMAKTTEAIKNRPLERKKKLFKQQLATRDDVDNAEKDLSDATMTREMYEK